MAPLTESSVLEALRVCYDPELAIDIVSLGRVYGIQVDPDTIAPGPDPRFRVIVQLLRRGSEEQNAMLAAQVANRLYGLREVSHAEANLIDTPAWSPNRIDPSARPAWSRKQGLIQLS